MASLTRVAQGRWYAPAALAVASVVLTLTAAFSSPPAGKQLRVPEEYATIAAAIAVAVDGDTVLVAPGVYHESLVLDGRRITLASWFIRSADPAHVEGTIIDGGGNAEQVVLVGAAQREPVEIVGVTIRNGEDCISARGRFDLSHSRVTGCSDGIDYQSGSRGTVRFNVFERNSDDGIDFDDDIEVVVEHNLIRDNHGDGIEVRLHTYQGATLRSVIRSNTILGNGEDGIQLIDYPDRSDREYVIADNLIVDNAQAGIGCMSEGVTREDFRGAAIPERVHLSGNRVQGNGRDFSCDAAMLAGSGIVLAEDGESSDGSRVGDHHVDATPILEEAFLTAPLAADNIDSPAVWLAPNGESWIVTTAKEGNRLVVHDAATGAARTPIASAGGGPGNVMRPNGVVIAGDVAFVVERDNRRVQGFRLPDGEPLGTFGESELVRPYGLTVVPRGPRAWDVYVTDAYVLADESIPADSALGARVKRYRVRDEGGRLDGELRHAFGETSGLGVLRQVESIHADPEMRRLLVADEASVDVKVYTLEGRFTGRTIGRGLLTTEPEGIALYACADGEGYWIVTDQAQEGNTFHVFERRSVAHVGAFRAAVTANTDGIALTQAPVGIWRGGVLYAIHDDQSVAALPWSRIAAALRLRPACDAPPETEPVQQVRSWLPGDHHIHSRFSVEWDTLAAPPTPIIGGDSDYAITINARKAREHGLAWMVSTDHGGPNHSKVNLQRAYPELLESRAEVPELIQFYGMELDTPGAEHSSLIVPHSHQEHHQLYDLERRFARKDAFPEDSTRQSEAHMLDALRAMKVSERPPVVIVNHPSRSAEGLGVYGANTPRELRGWNDAAPRVAVGMEGAPGHQASGLQRDGSADATGARGGYKEYPTMGGFDQMTARVGGFWDSMLGEGRRWWITSTSDSHRNWREGGNDFWPGEYSKTYVHALRQYEDVLDGIRSGRVFVTTGDLVSQLDVTVRAVGGAPAERSIGGTLPLSRGNDVRVVIRLRDPAGPNHHGDAPSVARVDLIVGEVTGPRSDPDGDSNPSARVVKRFTAADWRREGDVLTMEYTLRGVGRSSYVRVRGTNTAQLEPEVDPLGEDPWSDLWFYANPIFVEVR